ncbi:MAG: adenylyl-sulfate kinase [Candidatus Omnitrophica bacterium]|nr:adenylyl-sulfate kinase [Candidatus Omnitrophota bacterium]
MKSGAVFWFTGLSGAGKTTVAGGAQRALEREGYSVLILDGDQIRSGLHRDLGFSEAEIEENNARIAGLCEARRAEADVILVPIISPYRRSRQAAKKRLGGRCFEVYFDASLECVMKRDVKGLYAKAIRRELSGVIGFSPESVYETPLTPDFTVRSGAQTVDESVRDLVGFIKDCLRREGERKL